MFYVKGLFTDEEDIREYGSVFACLVADDRADADEKREYIMSLAGDCAFNVSVQICTVEV
jgi:hypothetical protein